MEVSDEENRWAVGILYAWVASDLIWVTVFVVRFLVRAVKAAPAS